MGELKSKRVGRKPKTHVFNELTELIKQSGYNVVQTCSELGIAIRNYDDYFRNPRLLSIERLQRVSYMTLTPLPKIVNMCLNCSKTAKNWFSEDSLPIDEKLELIKLNAAKSIK